MSHEIGVGGKLSAQIRSALAEPSASRWLATGLGLLGMLTAGRSLSKVLISANAIAWRVPTPKRASLRTVGSVAGLICVMGLLAIMVNRVREDYGLSVASASLLPTLVIYVIAWIGVSSYLPRGTTDPGALLPGALVVAVTITAMQALSEFYLPDKLSRAGALRRHRNHRRHTRVVLLHRQGGSSLDGDQRRRLRTLRQRVRTLLLSSGVTDPSGQVPPGPRLLRPRARDPGEVSCTVVRADRCA